MKKILAFILCAVLICAVPIAVSAEENPADAVETNPTVSENLPTEEESATEGENSPSETIPEKTVTEKIVEYVQSHFEEISVIGTLIVGMFYEIRKHGKLTGSIGTLNNNAITIANNSSDAIKKALEEVTDIAKVVDSYKGEIASLLAEIRTSAEEKKNLEDTLSNVQTFLKTAKSATIELSNEIADLLVLANIPNSVKEELFDRHKKAVHELEAAEEVMSNDGNET